MEAKFNLGDKVKCRVGGPGMVVGSVYPNGPAGGTYTITCYWWNIPSNSFQQWMFPEDALEDWDGKE